MIDMYELENELTYGTFASQQTVIDDFKIEQALKMIVNELSVVRSDALNATTQTQMIQSELEILKVEHKEALDIIRKMGKDYPEVVLAKPHMFVEDEFQRV